MELVADNHAAEVLEPGVYTLYLPAPLVTSQRSSVLGLLPVVAVWRNQYNSSRLKEHGVVPVAVVGLVTDQHAGVVGQCHAIQRSLDQRYFMRRGAVDVGCDRKTMAVCDNHDLGTLSALGLADLVAPFFALANVPSMKASSTLSLPRAAMSSARAFMIWSITPCRVQFWNQRCTVWKGGYLAGRSVQGAPVRRIQRMAQRTGRGDDGGRPFPSARRGFIGIKGSIRAHCALVRSMPNSSANAGQHLWSF